MEEVKRIIKEVIQLNGSDKIMLSFSTGKDAWATWCAIKDLCDVYPFMYYGPIDDLEYYQEYLAYCEKKIGRHIVRLPAPNTYQSLGAKALTYQPPHRCLVLEGINLPQFTFEDVQKAAANCWGLPENTYTALGVRAADSNRRALHFKKHGPISINQKKFYPVWHWKKDDLLSALTRENVKLPIDYKIFGRSFDGGYLLFAQKFKQHFPRDYQRMVEFFPFLELELYRYEKRQTLHNFQGQ